MDGTVRWALPLLFAGQAQKEMTHNEALVLIDALLHARVESADLSGPPGTPAVGQSWIVADGATDEWSGQDGAIALWTEGGWRFIAARRGLCVSVADRNCGFFYDGAEWRFGAVREDGLYMNEDKVVGARMSAIAAPGGGSVIDTEARSTLADILAALRGHGLIAT